MLHFYFWMSTKQRFLIYLPLVWKHFAAINQSVSWTEKHYSAGSFANRSILAVGLRKKICLLSQIRLRSNKIPLLLHIVFFLLKCGKFSRFLFSFLRSLSLFRTLSPLFVAVDVYGKSSKLETLRRSSEDVAFDSLKPADRPIELLKAQKALTV